MASLLDVFGFVAVLLRGLTLALSAIVLAGVVFPLAVLRGYTPELSTAIKLPFPTLQRLAQSAAISLIVVQAGYLSVNSALLAGTVGLTIQQIWGANFFVSGILCIVGSALIALSLWRSRVTPYHLVPALLILVALVMTSHSMARTDERAALAVLTGFHQGASSIWVGSLCFFLLTLRKLNDTAAIQTISNRFSRLAQISVACIIFSGVGLSLAYIGSVPAIYGTNYGVMVVAKVVLLGLMLLLGGFNFLLVGRFANFAQILLQRLKRFSEAEIGIGFTVILVAASLTSQPPAADLTNDRVSMAVITDRFTPRVPTLTTPPLKSLLPSSRQQWKDENGGSSAAYIPGQSYHPQNASGIAWSEYNHHWAGLVVFVAGLLATISRFRWGRWARHWPIAFLGLAVFLLVRADPENWPLGPNGFWESFSSAEVLQHRIFVALIVGFVFFEWGVQNGRLKKAWTSLVFPSVCALGGALLMTHTHALSNVKEELLAELSHIPLAIFGVITGWARWLELRLPGAERRIPAKIWPVSLMMVGVVLLLYREA